MKKLILVISVLLFFVAIIPAHAATCTQTGFFRDSINMTAALINPASVTGSVNATGCNIGVYYAPGKSGSINNANIYGSNYFGIVNRGGNVNVQNSKVHDIGETPLNGSQHGAAIYFATIDGSTCMSGSTKGSIVNNTVYNYQKGGVVANCTGTSVTISNNTVTGQGHINYIAQNGIQVGYGASATVSNNNVSGNSYTGANQASSGGIIVVGGPGYGGDYTVGTDIENNQLTNNDVGVYLSNLDAGNLAPTSVKTKVKAVNNMISNSGLYNTTGNGATGYQAGVSDVGNGDNIVNNNISGNGYSSTAHPGQCFAIDASSTNHVHLVNNLSVH